MLHARGIQRRHAVPVAMRRPDPQAWDRRLGTRCLGAIRASGCRPVAPAQPDGWGRCTPRGREDLPLRYRTAWLSDGMGPPGNPVDGRSSGLGAVLHRQTVYRLSCRSRQRADLCRRGLHDRAGRERGLDQCAGTHEQAACAPTGAPINRANPPGERMSSRTTLFGSESPFSRRGFGAVGPVVLASGQAACRQARRTAGPRRGARLRQRSIRATTMLRQADTTAFRSLRRHGRHC